MKKRESAGFTYKRVSLFIAFFILMSGVPTWADMTIRNVPIFKPYRLALGMELQSFKSVSNFGEEGQRQDLLAGHFLKSYDLQLKANLDLSEYWSSIVGVTLGYGESYNGDFRRSARRVKGINAGAFRLLQIRPGALFVFDGHAYMSLAKNSLKEDEVSLSDGAAWGQAGVWWVNELSKYFFYKMYAGFRGRNQSYSGLLVYKLGAQFDFKRFGAGFDFVGQMTVIDGSASNELEVERQQINAQYNARSFRYNAKNPEIEEIYLWTSYEFETMSFLKLGVHQVFGAKNTAEGFGFLLELESSFRIDNGGLSFPYFSKTRKRTKSKKNRVYLKNLGPDPDETKKSNTDPIF